MKKLPDLTKVEPLSAKDKPLMDDIVAVLRKHDALDRFGLTLLHQHFNIADEEILVEATDVVSRTQSITPMRRAEVENLSAIDTAWRLDSGEPIMSCKCLIAMPGHPHLPRPSDLRIKEGIKPLSGALPQLMELAAVTYQYRNRALPIPLPSGEQIGFIAQDVERIFPQLVSPISSSEAGAVSFLQVDYVGLIPVLVAALQEQQEQIARLYLSIKGQPTGDV